MARPEKMGLDYFHVEIGLYEDDKILYAQEIIDPLGNDPWLRFAIPSIAIRLLREIFKDGYYLNWDDKVALVLASKLDSVITMAVLKRIVDCLVESEFFNIEIFTKYRILTSAGIQKRWYFVVRNANRKNISVRGDIKLINEEDLERKTKWKNEKVKKKLTTNKTELITQETTENEQVSTPKGQVSTQIILFFSFIKYYNKDTIKHIISNKENKIFIIKENKRELIANKTELIANKTTLNQSEIQFNGRKNYKCPVKTYKIWEETKDNQPFYGIYHLESNQYSLAVKGFLSNKDFNNAWASWLVYQLTEHNFQYGGMSENLRIEQLYHAVGFDYEKAVKAIWRSIGRKWKDIFPDKNNDTTKTESNVGAFLQTEKPIEKKKYEIPKRNVPSEKAK